MIYTDSLQWTAKVSSSFDPSTEWFSFMSYKLADWTGKVGPNIANLITGVPEWQASGHNFTNTSNVYLQLELVPDDTRAGFVQPRMGIYWRSTNSTYFYAYAVGEYGEDASRDSYGTLGTSKVSSFGSQSSYFTSTYFNRGYPLHVAYCDTPGKEWFAWHDTRSQTIGNSGVLTRTTPAPGLDPGLGLGWAFISLNVQSCLGRYNTNATNNGYITRNEARPDSSIYPWIEQKPFVYSSSSFPVGTYNDIAECNLSLQHLSTVEAQDGRVYLVWGDFNTLIDVTGEF